MPQLDLSRVREFFATVKRSPKLAARVVLGALVAADLIAALIVLKPWAGSAEDLERQAASLSRELQGKQAGMQRLRLIAGKVQNARGDGDRFITGYLLGRRSVSSSLLLDLEQMAHKANLRQKEVTFAFEPIEGSDTLSKADITAAYEGSYANLLTFLNQLDRSHTLLIIDSLAATPQVQGDVLNIAMKLNAFVREGGEAPAEAVALETTPEPVPVNPAIRINPAPVRPVPVAVRPSAPAPEAQGPPPPPANLPFAAPPPRRRPHVRLHREPGQEPIPQPEATEQ